MIKLGRYVNYNLRIEIKCGKKLKKKKKKTKKLIGKKLIKDVIYYCVFSTIISRHLVCLENRSENIIP